MNITIRYKTLLAAITLVATTTIASAQDFPQTHIDAAKATINVTGSTQKLNEILPRSIVSLTDRLIGNRPDIADEISTIVNETAIELASRRGDLENEAAKIYARVFSEEQLQNISEFFGTESGKKFLSELPLVIREIDKASRVWGNGINRDLNQKVQEKMKAAGY